MRISANGHKIFVAQRVRAGTSAPPVVLLHGAAGQHNQWMAVARHMGTVTLHAPDLPGHGRSDGDGYDSVAAYAEQIIHLLDALEIERAILTGHSMGGAIAQQIALEHPERVAGLILVSTAARLKVHPTILENALSNPPAVADFIVEYGYGPMSSPELRQAGRAMILGTPPAVTLKDFTACEGFDVRERLSEISAPTLIIAGRKDRMTPAKFSYYLDEHIPDTTLQVIDHAGHMAPIEVPQAVATHITTWISAHWA